jgi:hypothetical protein
MLADARNRPGQGVGDDADERVDRLLLRDTAPRCRNR